MPKVKRDANNMQNIPQTERYKEMSIAKRHVIFSTGFSVNNHSRNSESCKLQTIIVLVLSFLIFFFCALGKWPKCYVEEEQQPVDGLFLR